MHIKLIIGYLDTVPVELLLDRFVKVKVYRPVVLGLYPRITGYSYSTLGKLGYPDFRLRLFKYKLMSVCDAFENLHCRFVGIVDCSGTCNTTAGQAIPSSR